MNSAATSEDSALSEDVADRSADVVVLAPDASGAAGSSPPWSRCRPTPSDTADPSQQRPYKHVPARCEDHHERPDSPAGLPVGSHHIPSIP
jgi:hypothetical protein